MGESATATPRPGGPRGPVRDPHADRLRERFHRHFAGAELPVPVEATPADLLGLLVEEGVELDCSGLLLPDERRIVLDAAEAAESPGRGRFTLAHEVGHWVCQVLEGRSEPVYCRAVDAGRPARPHPPLEREANVFAAELLMPESLVVAEWLRAASCAELARSFGVSENAMHWRLYNAGLVEERPQ